MKTGETIPDQWETPGRSTIIRTHPDEGKSVWHFGVWVRELRLRSSLAQGKLGDCIGWEKAASRISDLESGIAPVYRQLAEKIIGVFDLDPYERTVLLKAGRFLPSDQDVSQVRSDLQDSLDKSPFPKQIVDFGGRILVSNSLYLDTFGLPSKTAEQLQEQKPNYLEVMFDPSLGVRKKLEPEWAQTSKQAVDIFYLEQAINGKYGYGWQFSLINRLKNLPDFETLWQDAKSVGWKNLRHKYVFFSNEVVIKTGEDNKAYDVLHSQPLLTDARISTLSYAPKQS